MVIPALRSDGSLPPGRHKASWSEIERRAWIDGSFVTDKPAPKDFDGCWDTSGVDWTKLDAVLLTFDDERRAQKRKFGGEMFPSDGQADARGTTFLDFFQHDRDGRAKGIVEIDL